MSAHAQDLNLKLLWGRLEFTSTGGQTSAISSSNTVTALATSTISSSGSNPAPAKGFLANRVLSGTVFGLVGLVSLIFLIVIASCVIKRRRKKKLLEDAVPVRFEPVMGTDTMRKQIPRNYQTDPPPYHLDPPSN
ncbi:hypothetical protein BYT27DRAFT_7188823 [Phlegmacium glaucopus]|nr:hypothetical protein BYT27DRAFT_7188823 [Phlegmacium glaucopus]